VADLPAFRLLAHLAALLSRLELVGIATAPGEHELAAEASLFVVEPLGRALRAVAGLHRQVTIVSLTGDALSRMQTYDDQLKLNTLFITAYFLNYFV